VPKTKKAIEPATSLSGNDLGTLLDVVRTVGPAIWPSAADVAAAVQRVRDTAVESVRFTHDERGARVIERRRRKHRLSMRQARKRFDPLDVSIGAAMFVEEVKRCSPALLDGKDLPAVATDVENRWREVQRQHPGQDEDTLSQRLLSAGLAAIGVADPTHGVMRKIRPSRKRSAREAAEAAFGGWSLDRCEVGSGELPLPVALADYERQRVTAGAPELTTKRMSVLLAAMPGVRRFTQGRAKVVTFAGVQLRPDVAEAAANGGDARDG
jgi:hypothetical protein